MMIQLKTDRGVTRLKLGFIFACCAARDFVNSDHPGHRQLRISSCHQNGDGDRPEKCSEVDIYILCFRKYCCFCQIRPPPDAEYLFSKSKHFPSSSIFHPGPCAQIRGTKLLIRKLLI